MQARFLFTILLLSAPLLITAKTSVIDLPIKIYTDNKQTENLGYGNCNLHEDGEYLMIKNFISTGAIVIDAGAHLGEWSDLVLKHTKNSCKLYAFEPVPYFFSKLTDLVSPVAQCYNTALGKTEGEALMNYYYIGYEGCSSLFDRKVLSTIPVKKIKVPILSLDKFCHDKQIQHIDFLKIDVEGAEWDMLQGADRLITNKQIDTIQFEYGGTYPDANITLKQVYSYLTTKGYAIFRLIADGLVHIPKWRDGLENNHLSNYLAVLS